MLFSLSTGGFLRKADSTLVLKMHTKQTPEKIEFMPKNTATKMPFKNSISGYIMPRNLDYNCRSRIPSPAAQGCLEGGAHVSRAVVE
jgi:hypothetical protein